MSGSAPRPTWLDGNEAAASVAHRLSELCALYPITPASPMGEHAEAWSERGRTNLWGQVPRIVQMQSEAGAIAALHGAVQSGALATSFTSSQGLLLMLPNMFKIAGELTPAVLHVAARAVATHALSIFGDHSDVMAARSTGWAMLASATVQEAHDLAAVAHAATLTSRVPFVHFFDGFRTSHEISPAHLLPNDDLRALVDDDALRAHRDRALRPSAPVLRGTAQNPDVFFQSREAANPFHLAVPGVVTTTMARLAELTGRHYAPVEYHGSPRADRVVVAMGSAVRTVRATVDALLARGEDVGVVTVRLFRPFPAAELAAVVPATARAVAVLDRTKEPGASAEPLHLDVLTALSEHRDRMPRVIGGRYGLGSKEFTPRDAAAVFTELAGAVAGGEHRRRFTVGITDDVTGLSLPTDPGFHLPSPAVEAVLYGLGSDGTVGANRAAIQLIGEHTDRWAQGYFLHDSKKSGSVTTSHLRFGPEPIDAPYLIERADFVGVHQFGLLGRLPVLDAARPGATVLLACPAPADVAWDRLPAAVRRAVLAKDLRVHVVDAAGIARRAGLGPRISTAMQACFFALTGVLPGDWRRLVEDSARAAYAKHGPDVVEANLTAIREALATLAPLVVPAGATVAEAGPTDAGPTDAGPARASNGTPGPVDVVIGTGPGDLAATVRRLVAGQGEALPVSALPADGTFPTGTAALEKRAVAEEVPVWTPQGCIDCGKCAIVCPHAAIRMKVFDEAALLGAPEGFPAKATQGREFPEGSRLTVQVSPDDCTGCTLCVEACPADVLTMTPFAEVAETERERFDHFLTIPEADRSALRTDTVKGSQLMQPLFEFSGACSGCGETPYLGLLSRLLGDRMVVANATGCSSIYGGNLPTTPWTTDAAGRGPAWNNSLFEDNAEFGLGITLGTQARSERARALVRALAPVLGDGLVGELLPDVPVTDEGAVAARRGAVERLRAALAAARGADDAAAIGELTELADALVPTSVWTVGGDGWAYDIGFGGLDHVLASGLDVNVLVLDSEVYSNTGGQASKATPLGASARFASGGKGTRKKDLALFAHGYRDVYVAQIALGANEMQAVRALREAAAYPGPSLVLAYSPCREQGLDLSLALAHQRAAVASGHWPLLRYHPEPRPGAEPHFRLDSKAPSIPLAEFYASEARFRAVAQRDPERAHDLLTRAQAHVDERWAEYARLAGK